MRQSALVGAALAALALGMGPVACVSDAQPPDCNQTSEAPCAVGTGGSAGAAETAGGTAPGGSGGGGGSGAVGGSAVNDAGAGGEIGGAGDGGAGASNAGSSNGGTGAALGNAGSSNGGANNGGTSAAAGTGGTGSVLCSNCIAPTALPAPCGTNPYLFELSVSGGSPPYTWQITPPVDPWQVTADPATPNGASAKLSGQASGNSSITVVVSDHNGKFAQQVYAVLPRGACWFGSASLAADGPRLDLVDPILAPNSPVPLAGNPGVYDFHFSPDGQYLAYRYGQDSSHPTGAHLALVNLQSTPTETPLTFGEDAVTAFAWSGDSTVLAVAFTTGGVSNLGGIRIDASDAAASSGYSTLTAIPALVQSDLYWLQGNAVAFYAAVLPDVDNPGQFDPTPDQRTAFAAPLGSDGFTAPVTFDAVSYAPGVFVQPAGPGFFVVSPLDQDVDFNWLSSGAPQSSDESTNFISPSGVFSAGLDGSALQIFHAQGGILSPLVAQSDPTAAGCPEFLTWAKDRERMACVADVVNGTATHGEIRFFDLQSDSTLTMSTLGGFCVKDGSSPQCGAIEYDYTEATASAHARAFSPSGRWFAFTAPSIDGANYLYWADLNNQPLQLQRKITYAIFGTTSTATSPTAISFSQDENYLLYQRGSTLIAEDLRLPQSAGSVSSEPPISTTLPDGTSQATSACSEDFVSAPDRWCGNPNRSAPFTWASDSRFAAYRAAGKVTVVDMTQVTSYQSQQLPGIDCSDECQNQFEFQPQAP